MQKIYLYHIIFYLKSNGQKAKIYKHLKTKDVKKIKYVTKLEKTSPNFLQSRSRDFSVLCATNIIAATFDSSSSFIIGDKTIWKNDLALK